MRFFSAGVVLIGLLSSSAVAFAEEAPRKMTLADCVREAMVRNPDVQTAHDEIAVAAAQRWEIGGQMFPKLRVEASVQEWGAPYVIQFSPPPAPGLTFHDQFTWTFTAQMIQPLTPLIPLLEQYHVRDVGVDIAHIRKDVAHRDTAYRVIETYYRLLEAERLAEVAVTSVDQLTGQLKQANSFHDSGVVSKDDVLRAELALANAKQRAIQTRGQVTLWRSRLATVIGLSPSTTIDIVPLASEPTPASETTLERAVATSRTGRVEIRELDERIDQSKVGVRLAWYKMLPAVNLVGAYMHNQQLENPTNPANPQFIELNSVYIGGAVSWDVWDFGSSLAGVKEANAKLREAKTARDKVRDQLDLEVREAFLNEGTAIEAMNVAQASVKSAEEHYRLVTKRYEANTTTSFDVVDAESLLTQARAQLQTSTYDFLIARAALRRAMGESPQEQQRP
jgi:outer membrane protein TolC